MMENCYRSALVSAEHLLGIAELERLCFSSPWSESALALLCRDKNFGVVILNTADGLPVAYGGMLTVLDEGQILNLAVHPDHRRKGLGEEILRLLIENAQKRNLTLLSLEVRESNLSALALYEKAGFVRRGLRRNFYAAPQESAVVMTKELERMN